MLRKGQIPFSGILMLVDAAVVFASFLISFWIRFYSGLLPLHKGVPLFKPYLVGSLVVALLWILVFWLLGLYETRLRLTKDEEVYRVGKGAFVCVVAVMAFSFFYREVVWSRLVLIMASAISFLLVSAERVVLVVVFRRWMAKHGYGIKRSALIGSGKTAKHILEYVNQHPEYGYRIDCLLSIEGFAESGWRGSKSLLCERLSSVAGLSGAIDKHRLAALFIVLPHELQPRVIEIVNSTEHRPVELKFVPDMIDVISSSTKVSQLGEMPVIGLRELPLTDWDIIIKSAFDFTLAMLGIILISPLLLVIAILVKVTSRGPLIYSQERVGFDGRIFKMYKFRSMMVDAEKETGPVWAKVVDDRRTPIGAVLRRYSLDELPQLLNVLKGDMSLVGPRPERPFFVEKFKLQVPGYASRHRMKSGITGWAQVHGLRGATSIEKRTTFDIYYIQNWSLLLDMKILIRTVLQVIIPDNAY
jgi:exopolysaccharide biosynthesis polyprenyl glycosylphosphotransferase